MQQQTSKRILSHWSSRFLRLLTPKLPTPPYAYNLQIQIMVSDCICVNATLFFRELQFELRGLFGVSTTISQTPLTTNRRSLLFWLILVFCNTSATNCHSNSEIRFFAENPQLAYIFAGIISAPYITKLIVFGEIISLVEIFNTIPQLKSTAVCRIFKKFRIQYKLKSFSIKFHGTVYISTYRIQIPKKKKTEINLQRTCLLKYRMLIIFCRNNCCR